MGGYEIEQLPVFEVGQELLLMRLVEAFRNRPPSEQEELDSCTQAVIGLSKATVSRTT